jgi:hypothetical protein
LRFLVWRQNSFEQRAYTFLLGGISLSEQVDVFPALQIILPGVTSGSVPLPLENSQAASDGTNAMANAGSLASASVNSGKPLRERAVAIAFGRYGAGVTFALFVATAGCRLPFSWK